MIIRKIKIRRFGIIKYKEIEFKEGINIVKGSNEAGKTTLQYFIKSFLYGMSSKRSKYIRDNIRAKYASFNGERAQGELEIERQNEDILIIRAFGLSKKEDTVKVVDGLTGNEISELSYDEPGKYILNVSGDSFENTLFVKGLGTHINSSKDDEVMNKLTNSLESGEEGVSYFKALEKLEAVRKSLTTIRSNGKLDILKVRKIEALEERENFLKASNENLENEIKIIKLKKEIEDLRIRLKKLEIYKKHLKKIKLQKEYKDILEYLKKSEKLKNQAKEIDGELERENGIVKIENIESLREENAVILSLYKMLEDKEKEKKTIEEEKIEVEDKLKEFKKIQELGEDLEEKLINISKELDKYKGKMVIYEEYEKDLREHNDRLNKIQESLGANIKIESYEEDIDKILKEYENKVIQLKERVLERKVINSQEEIDGIKFAKNIFGIIIILGVIGSISLVFIKPVLSILPLIISGVFLVLNFNKSQKVEELNRYKEEEKYIENLEESLRETELKLMEYGKTLNLNSYEEFGKALSSYKKYKDEIKTLNRLIEEKENKLKSYEIEELNRRNKENKEILFRILDYTKTKDIDELLSKIKLLNASITRCEIVTHKFKTFMESFNALKNDISRKEESLREKLKYLRLNNSTFYELPKELDKLAEKLKEKDRILYALNGVNETYRALLKDREIEEIKGEVKELLSDSLEYSYENEEEVEEELKISQNKLLETEKELKDVENSVLNRFLGIRSLISIEADLDDISSKINYYEKELKAINLAKELLEESFKELQKNIGPILNNKVSYYFAKLTGEKYREVRVGDKYELLVRNEKGEIIKGDYLSNGTWDQVYLSLRLALVDMLFGNEKVPLIFDDAFIQYDDHRLINTLDALKEISFKRQIILFSCQNREINLLEKTANVINLP